MSNTGEAKNEESDIYYCNCSRRLGSVKCSSTGPHRSHPGNADEGSSCRYMGPKKEQKIVEEMQGEKLLTISSLAQQEVESLSKNVKKGLKMRRGDGRKHRKWKSIR